MATANQEWFDALLRHQIHLLRVSGSIRNKIFELLNATEEDIAERVRERLKNAPGLPLSRRLERGETLSRIIQNMRVEAWDKVDQVWLDEMKAIAREEPKILRGTLQTVAPVVVGATLPEVSQLEAIVNSQPFQGKTLKQWASGVRQADLSRMDSQIKIGLVQGENSQQIARRIVGSARARGADGVFQITRNNAQAITRTAVNHTSNMARQAFLKANKEVVRKERFVATLDSRTTPVCMSNDGKLFRLADGPNPPLHVNCRSIRVAELDRDSMADRPMKRSTERQLTREYTRANNLKRATRRADLPHGHKGAFDQFKRGRVRELTGTVPGRTTYQQFLGRQSREFQEDVLGVTKARLFREGNLRLDKFVNRAGDELNLSQLARREAAAFRAAGLDPEDFL